jgi:cytochrome d ubiquinol oxidase subunit II
VQQAAAGHDTLVWVLVCVGAGGAILFPSLALLFRLAVSRRFQAAESAETATPTATTDTPATSSPLLARVAVACLLAGVGLLNVADAGWAHAVGIACLFGFIVAAFRVIISSTLDRKPA